MSLINPRYVRPPEAKHPLSLYLANGDRLIQGEFHRRYETYPDDVKFELVGGVVYLASPVTIWHSNFDGAVGFLLAYYSMSTQGVESLHNVTTILGPESEPQPDWVLRILPRFGGASRDCAISKMKYLGGSPELIAEIANSRRSLDMHAKKDDYKRAGVQEYLVVCVEEKELHWFNLPARRALQPNGQGIYKSRVFPGLWIDGTALLARKSQKLLEVL